MENKGEMKNNVHLPFIQYLLNSNYTLYYLGYTSEQQPKKLLLCFNPEDSTMIILIRIITMLNIFNKKYFSWQLSFNQLNALGMIEE